MALIKINTINETPLATDFIHESFAERQCIICKSPEKLQLLLNEIAVNAERSLHFVSDGDWSMHDLLGELVKDYPNGILYITTYALRELAVRQLIMAMEKGLIKAIYLLLDSRAKTRIPEVYQLAKLNFTHIYLTEIHAKVTILKAPNKTISIIGSANFTTNPRIEVGVVDTSKNAANFHIEWIEKKLAHANIFE